MENVINTLHLSGKVIGTPVVGHEAFGEKFYYLTLGVPRLSGAEDQLPVTLSERLLDGAALKEGDVLSIEGQVRSYNKIIEGAGRLLITAFAQKIVSADERENPNQIQLTGTLCKAPAYRTTPFGREIADMMLAVNRAYGKSDYIPCITWGRTARFASHLKVGDKVTLLGRFQSRAYQKQLADGTVLNKTAYEVSVGRLSMADTIVQPSAPFVIRPGVREEAPMHYETVTMDSGFLSNPQ
jgi:primosomal replication protein N